MCILAYLDDVVIARPPNDVLEGFNTLKEASKGTGLNINLRKCSLFTSSDEQPLDALPQDIEVQKEGIRLLGSPIGTKDEFEDDWCKAFAEDCARDLAVIEEYGKDNPQAAFHFLRLWFAPKINHRLSLQATCELQQPNMTNTFGRHSRRFTTSDLQMR